MDAQKMNAKKGSDILIKRIHHFIVVLYISRTSRFIMYKDCNVVWLRIWNYVNKSFL